MKKIFLLLAAVIQLGIIARGATYYSYQAGAFTNALMWYTNPLNPGGSRVTVTSAMVNSGHTFNIQHAMTDGTGQPYTHSTLNILNGGSFTKINAFDIKNATINVENGGSVTILGSLITDDGTFQTLTNYGTVRIDGNSTGYATINTKGTGNTTIKGNIDNTTINLTETGSMTAGVAGLGVGISNTNVTTSAGTTLNILGNNGITENSPYDKTFVNNGTANITGNVTNLASFETRGSGGTTVKGTIDNTSIVTADAGVLTVGTAVTNKDITNSNITIGAGSSMQLYGNLTESDPANQTLTNNGTATITGRIAIKTTDNTGTLTVGNIDKMNSSNVVSVTNSGIMTITTAQSYIDGKRTITNSGTLIFNGDLTVNNANSGAENILSSSGTLTVGGSLSLSNLTAPVSLNNTTIISSVTINKATVTNSGKLDVGNNLSLDEGNLTVNGNLKVVKEISINKGALITGNGTSNTAQTLKTSNPPATLTNNGSLIIDLPSTFSNHFKLINNNYIKLPGSYSFGGAGQLTNNGVIDIGGSLSFDGTVTASNSLNSKINITGDLNILGASNTVNNYGDIAVNGKLYFTNGVLNNYRTVNGTTTTKASLIVAGTGSLLNSTAHISNAGIIDFTQLLTITNTVIQNQIAGAPGHINAKGGIKLENNGCIAGGSTDYWGSITYGTGGCTISNLPISLTSLRGFLTNQGVQLIWITESETNNNYFQIEVSTDGRNYSLLGTIDGAGNSTIETKYTFLHEQPRVGVNYYRLSQTDFDGQKRYFTPIAVHYSHLEALIYPTVIHADQIVNVHLSDVTDNIPFQIVSQDGKVIEVGTISANAQLPSDFFQFGLNQLIIGSDSNSISTSIVKQ